MNAHVQNIDANAASVRLSPRESEVLPLLLMGYSSKEIARDLNISPRTVDIYRSAILGKFRVRKTAQLFYLLRGIDFGFDAMAA